MMNRKGFTLVELMVVLAILGLLAGIGIPSYLNVLNRAKIGADIARIAQVQTNVDAFIAEIGGWDKVGTLTDATPPVFAEIADPAAATAMTLTGAGRLAGISIITGSPVELKSFFDDGEPKEPKTYFESTGIKDVPAATWFIENGKVFVGTATNAKLLP